ncbi:MAG: sugar ABC transporter ATP-binding protein [Candidatus Dormibacteraeota bacterium]|uniref:Sugar ABC transporter ATP-binding protein n=1 Tax=Candidatus Dormiibacter inghamiae TaxID=3127013 RepID=A0A934KG80_9BACT|nr:sugar ABC transporter ATP-binding protein [Candidatus Dormibacteraeota bacterium]MBJ7606432.1 sugar ABC transporter ATP-binding protein [Candidatus Dormibacteraeota bacterium]
MPALSSPPSPGSAGGGAGAGDALLIEKVSKGFANVQALSDVSLEVRPGEVLALMGENGAGKSTLLRILSGDYQPDQGWLTLAGQRLTFASPRQARQSGIRVIYQEAEIIPGVDVAENIYAGELPRRGPFVDRGRLAALVREAIKEYGFGTVLPAHADGDKLSPAQRQLVEILRALKSGVKVLALDEPTSSLTDEQVESLFVLIRRLRSEGVAIIYVSHRMREMLQIADRIAVLRDGRLVAVRPVKETSEGEIVRLMVGRDLTDVLERTPSASSRIVLRVRDLNSDWHRGISFEIKAGEVLGFAGLVGAGRTELAKVVFGDYRRNSGTIEVDGRAVDIRHPSHAIAAGIGLAPEDRKGDGLVLIRSVQENVALAILRRLSRFRFIRAALERRVVREYVDRLRIRTPSIGQQVAKLSGGNQQKVVLARWLAAHPKVLILDEPTRGIDVGAKAEIYRLINELANEGIGIMLISSELPEILGLADRVLVMQKGRITGELSAAEATEEKVLELAMLDQLTVESETA